MDFDQLSTAVETLERDRDRLRQDAERLRREFDQLNSKLRYPGTKFLVDLEYQLLYEGSWSIGGGAVVVTPVFDTLPGKLHAVYALSAYALTDTAAIIVVDGSVISPPVTTVTVGIRRQLRSAPTRIEASLILDNAGGAAVAIAIRVWRRLGIGSS